MKKTAVTTLTRLAILSAVIIIMSFTPLGYLQIGPLALTFLTIPVAVGAVVMGPAAGAFLGLVFGITSFINSFSGVMGQALLAINPFFTFILCVVPRVLEGFLSALIYKALSKKDKKGIWSVSAASISCPVLNTILFMSTLVLLFGRSDYILNLRNGANVFVFVCTMVGIQAVVEAVVCAVAAALISSAMIKIFKR